MHSAIRAAGYLSIPLVAAATPLLALPAITSAFGSAAWAAVAIGQSTGAAAATLVELGWGLNGPQRVARMSERNAYYALHLSVLTRLLVLIPAATLAALMTFVLTREFRFDAVLLSVASTSTALSAAWFFLGKSRPWTLIASDGLPRLIAVMIASICIMAGGPLVIYPAVGVLLPSIIAPLIAFLVVRPPSTPRPKFGIKKLIRATRMQFAALTTRVSSAAYIALPITLVGIASPESVAVFAAGERLMRMGLSAIAIFPNAMQGWVGQLAQRERRWHRARRAIFLNVLLGVVAACIYGTLAPLVSSWVFSGVATLPPGVSWTFSAVIVVVVISRATGGLGLVSLGMIPTYARSALIGAVVGVPSILLLAHFLHAPGGALGEVVAEIAVLATQVLGIAQMRRLAGRDRVAPPA